MDVEFGWQGSHGGLVAYYGLGALIKVPNVSLIEHPY